MSKSRAIVNILISRRNLLQISLLSFFGIASSQAATFSIKATLDGTPGANSARISVLANQSVKVYIEYGFAKGKYIYKSVTTTTKANVPTLLNLEKLTPKTKIYYRLRYALNSTGTFLAKPEASFLTALASDNSKIGRASCRERV